MIPPLSSSSVLEPVVSDDTQIESPFGHYCGTHIFDRQCEENPTACIAFCGWDFKGSTEWNQSKPECVVCAQMLDARGDCDLEDPYA